MCSLLYMYDGSGGDVKQCLSEVSPHLRSLISVWSAEEQRILGEAFMKVSKLTNRLMTAHTLAVLPLL